MAYTTICDRCKGLLEKPRTNNNKTKSNICQKCQKAASLLRGAAHRRKNKEKKLGNTV